jgi:hypothetical protein
MTLTMRFTPYQETGAVPNVVVDGAPNDATVLTLSHWPGIAAPPACAADTSTEMVFRYLDRGADLHGEARSVTNNHFDQDGLAGIHALIRPEAAQERRNLVIGLAVAGDFAVATDRAAARLSMAVAALADEERTPLGSLPAGHDERCSVLYDAALGVLPGWLEDPESCRPLWAEEDAQLDAGLDAIRSGSVRITEDVELDLAVVTLPDAARSTGHRFTARSFGGVHPIALHGATERTVLLAVDPTDGRHRLTCRYEGWVQFRSRPIRPRVDLRPLAEKLTAEERTGVRWSATAPSDLTPELFPDGGGSTIEPDGLVAAVEDHLRSAPPAWDPFPSGGL